MTFFKLRENLLEMMKHGTSNDRDYVLSTQQSNYCDTWLLELKVIDWFVYCVRYISRRKIKSKYWVMWLLQLSVMGLGSLRLGNLGFRVRGFGVECMVIESLWMHCSRYRIVVYDRVVDSATLTTCTRHSLTSRSENTISFVWLCYQ